LFEEDGKGPYPKQNLKKTSNLLSGESPEKLPASYVLPLRPGPNTISYSNLKALSLAAGIVVVGGIGAPFRVRPL